MQQSNKTKRIFFQKKIQLLFILFLLSANVGFAQTYDELINKSFDCLDKENYVCAEESLKDAMRKEPANPGNALLLSNLGTIQRKLGKFDDALLSYTAALASNRQNTVLLMNRAALYAQMDSLPAALNDYNEILTYNPDDEPALSSAGLIYIEMNDTLLARENFAKILKKNPRSIDGRVGFATLDKIAGDYATAELLFSEVLKEDPQNYYLYLQRSEVYFATNRFDKAMEDVNIYLGKYPDDEYAYFLRGQIKYGLWERMGACTDFQHAKLLGYDSKVLDEMLKKCK